MIARKLQVCLLWSLLVSSSLALPQTQVTVGGDVVSGLQDKAARANTDFGLELLRRVSQPGKNIFFSPYSISSALAMVYLGARGNTAQEIGTAAKFLQYLGAPDDVHAVYQSFVQRYNSGQNKNYTLNTANHLFVQDGFDILPKFQQEMQEYYKAMLEELDFKNNAEAARNRVNNVVSKDTNGKIRELFPAGSLEADTILALVNAVYFKGTWKTQFDPLLTKPEIFQTTSTSVTTAPMMQVTGDFEFAFSEELDSKILRMPYSGDSLSMVIILPESTDGLPDLLKRLNTDSLHQLRRSMFRTKVNVKVPKMKVENQFSLNEPLAQLGINDAFTGRADLSGMAKTSSAQPLALNKVRHAAAVELDEFGSTAAAATGGSVVALSALNYGPRVITFHANHPYFYAIMDDSNRMVLFAGLHYGNNNGRKVSNQPRPIHRPTPQDIPRQVPVAPSQATFLMLTEMFEPTSTIPSSTTLPTPKSFPEKQQPTSKSRTVQTQASTFTAADRNDAPTSIFQRTYNTDGSRPSFLPNYESQFRNFLTTLRTNVDPFSFIKFVSFAKPHPPPRSSGERKDDVL